MNLPPWMTVAAAEVGVQTFPPGQSNPRITAYHANTNISGYDDKASWCSSFVNWSLEQVGIAGTRSALARSWLEWGEPLDAPVRGCIVVLYRGGIVGELDAAEATEEKIGILMAGGSLDALEPKTHDAPAPESAR